MQIFVTSQPAAGKALRISLWIVQTLMFLAFLLFGFQKLFMAPEALAAMWHSSWPVEHPLLLHVTGAIDVAGGLGLLLPALTRIRPNLTVLAALGCVLLQLAAIAFHSMRGEFAALPLNAVLLPLAAFILWGRRQVPISPRTSQSVA
ncbi:putative membrane protein YphA (DoxX/SURF4 family) [Xanthomonas sp. JAI131]|jgi:uncharacterized membrane protein YphA (DoxX/SURF4 family)|uniref:DoxX family protein n=1 Tax=Xanthomonas sp. JAI131 TaxID=2723067 RepID=UPI0015CC5DA3|nr:DoxX family protein [Xanthomonas sp. JAI131]NYF19969.1 putative membrane protein YphA (DoxX/SURF4 family) [Xanthomonas sp. JAI131]